MICHVALILVTVSNLVIIDNTGADEKEPFTRQKLVIHAADSDRYKLVDL